MAAHAQPPISPESYLQLDRASGIRHEYYHGQMFAMSGGTYTHARIIANLTGELYNSLKNGTCEVASNDIRLCIHPDGLYTYPDIVVVCGEPEFLDTRRDTLLNPALLIDVLSPSTEAYDRGFKSAQYRKIASLGEYVLVSQSEPRVEIYTRHQAGSWLLTEATGIRSDCHFATLDFSLALAGIYSKITFSNENPLIPQISDHPRHLQIKKEEL